MRKVAAAAVALGLVFTLSACTETSDDKARREAQSKKAQGQTLEKTNLEEKRKREDNADAIRYVYLTNFGNPIGYYVTKGKISSNGSQATPEQDIHWTCDSHCDHLVVDGPQDDGSYGQGDPGVFFFLVDGTMVVTSFDYIQTDRPMSGVNVPQLG